MKPIDPIHIREQFGIVGLGVIQFIQSSLDIHNHRHGTQIKIFSHDNARYFVITPSLNISLSSVKAILKNCPRRGWSPIVSKDVSYSVSFVISLSSLSFSPSSLHSSFATESSKDLVRGISATPRVIRAVTQKENPFTTRNGTKTSFPVAGIIF
jgi:hypothetical protein